MSQHAEILCKGGYRARFAAGQQDLTAAQALRTQCFGTGDTDLDKFDALCSHILIEDLRTGFLVCAFRLLHLSDGQGIAHSYSAQFYDLSRLADYPHAMIEVGRFCSHPTWRHPDILRLAWAVLTRIVDKNGAQMLFGCSSFAGTNAEPHFHAFAALQRRYLAPDRWRPLAKAPNLVHFDQLQRANDIDAQAIQTIPPLLRSYLMMGGWVSDHAVVDTELNTLHVFTGLEVGSISESRRRLLRGMAG